MKRIVIIATLAAILCACGGNTNKGQAAGDNSEIASSKSDKTDESKKLPFKQGSYIETSKMMGMELSKTVYFDKWGEWTSTEDKSEMTIAGYTSKTDKIEIVKGTTHWDIDLIEKTGTQYESITLPKGMEAALATAMAGEVQEGTEIEELGEENYLGYNCKKVRVKYKDMNMDVTTWSYGNLTMKMEGKMGDSPIYTAITKIDESAPPAAKFEVPDGIEIQKQ